MSMHAVTEKDISKDDLMAIWRDGSLLYCHILVMGRSTLTAS